VKPVSSSERLPPSDSAARPGADPVPPSGQPQTMREVGKPPLPPSNPEPHSNTTPEPSRGTSSEPPPSVIRTTSNSVNPPDPTDPPLTPPSQASQAHPDSFSSPEPPHTKLVLTRPLSAPSPPTNTSFWRKKGDATPDSDPSLPSSTRSFKTAPETQDERKTALAESEVYFNASSPKNRTTASSLGKMMKAGWKGSLNVLSFKKNGSRMQKQFKRLTDSPLKAIPAKCLKLWRENCWIELNRFAKLSSTPYLTSVKGEKIPWNSRIVQDLQRYEVLGVKGDINEVFEFPRFDEVEDRETLVDTAIKFLYTAIEDLIKDVCASLGRDGRSALAKKAVNQALISLCQDFINDPYFKILKNACEEHNLTPTSSKFDTEVTKDWTSGVNIEVKTPVLNCTVCRTFKTMKFDGLEAEESDTVFGFKRTYIIDILGGPPKITPPIWLAKNKSKTLEFHCDKFPKDHFGASFSPEGDRRKNSKKRKEVKAQIEKNLVF